MKLDVLIVDDEPLSCARIRRMLNSDPLIASVRVAHHGKEALDMIRHAPPHLLFLDIEMPGLDGFAMLQEMPDRERPCIVFVTAYEEHAARAFDVSAADYLVKPFSRPRFQQALDKARKELRDRAAGTAPSQPARLAVREAGALRFVKTEDIDWVEADGHFVRLHMGQTSVLMRERIGVLASRLDSQRFARIHRSTIVNVDRIEKLQPLFHGDYSVTLRDGTRLVLSRSYHSVFNRLTGT